MGAMFQMPPGFFNQRDFRADEQNAMLRQQALEQGTIRTTEMQEAQRKRQDLEGVLRASQNPEKDALLWAQRNDFDMHTKLSQLYFQKLVGEAQIDPDQAVANFTRRTGEPMQFVSGAKDWLSFQNNGQTTLFNLRSGEVKTIGQAKADLHNVPANTDVINAVGELVYQSEPKPTAESTAGRGRTVRIGDRVKQFNPDTGKYDIDVGPAPPASSAATGAGGGSGLVDAVLANPALFNQLGAKERAAIAPELSRRGFDQFGKAASDTALKEIKEVDLALGSLDELATMINENKQYMGPVAGAITSVNPWSQGKNLQSAFALVRQKIGKALEGGVLRKEDEIKYRTILGDIISTPENALFNIDQLKQMMQRDKALFNQTLGQGGRNVPQIGAGRIVQRNKTTGQYRHSTDGGKTWQPGQ